jgi:hypothetical protein
MFYLLIYRGDYKSNPTVFMLAGIGILPKRMFCLILISGRQEQVIIVDYASLF